MVYGNGTTNLIITDCKFLNNTAYTAGAIGIEARGATVNTTISNSLFSGNLADASGPGAVGAGIGGGAISNFAAGDNYIDGVSNLTINNSTFSNNTVNNDDTSNGSVQGGSAILNVVFAESGLSTRIGASAYGNINIYNSTFNNNVSINHNNGFGSAITNYVYGHPDASIGSMPRGVSHGIINIINSTLTGNIGYKGGAVSSMVYTGSSSPQDAESIIRIINSTLANNTANEGGGIYNGNITYSPGDPIDPNTAIVIMKNSLLVANTNGNCSGPGVFSGGLNNLEYTGAAGATTCGAGSSFTITNPLAAAGLTDNGGPTKTIALAVGSPALDAGDATTCTDPATVNNRDQRGGSRHWGTSCEIGAYEVETGPALALTPANLNFRATIGGANPAPQNITIGNAAFFTGPLDWNSGPINYGTGGSGWLACSPPSGGTGLGPQASTTLSCQATTGALAVGTYTASFPITSPTSGVVGSPQTVNLTFEVLNLPSVVTLKDDNGNGDTYGSLSYALQTTVSGKVTFKLPPGFNTVKVAKPLLTVKTGVKIEGNCTPGPRIIIDGTGVSGDGLILSGGNLIDGIEIKGFSGRQLRANNLGSLGPNIITCTKLHRN